MRIILAMQVSVTNQCFYLAAPKSFSHSQDPERPFRPQPIHRFNCLLGCDEAALAGSDATLDGERGPCNEASFRRREIENCCRDFRRSAYAFQGIPIRLLDEV